jgi:hypothetical protein
MMITVGQQLVCALELVEDAVVTGMPVPVVEGHAPPGILELFRQFYSNPI